MHTQNLRYEKVVKNYVVLCKTRVFKLAFNALNYEADCRN